MIEAAIHAPGVFAVAGFVGLVIFAAWTIYFGIRSIK